METAEELITAYSDGQRDFARASLRHANLHRANLSDARLRRADLNSAYLRRAILNGVDFVDADLSGANLDSANLSNSKLRRVALLDANLRRANLSGADFHAAELIDVDLVGANLCGTDLSGASLNGVDLTLANLTGADLSGANLVDANLSGANLTGANLSGANLRRAALIDANLGNTNFSGAWFGSSSIAAVDLSIAASLQETQHDGPSSVGTNVLNLTTIGLLGNPSKRIAVETFLRGCGLADWEILLARLKMPGLSGPEIAEIQNDAFQLRVTTVVQLHNLFISYSRADSDFVDAVERRLNAKHIRFWRDVHEMKAGRLDKQIDRGMRQSPTVLLVLSSAAVESDRVESEVRRARRLEKELKRDCLCPVVVDLAPREVLAIIAERWDQETADQIAKYNVLDFRGWNEGRKLDREFQKLLDGLALFYEPPKKST